MRRARRVLGITIAAFLLVLVAFRLLAWRREALEPKAAAPPSGRFVRAADVDIFVQELGPAEAPAAVFIHGTGAWSETWRESMVAAAAAGVRAIGVDLPPFGYSEKPSGHGYTRPEQARRILGVLAALHLDRATLVGHSFGAGATVEAALLAPERVAALVLVDAALGLDQPNLPPALPLRAFFASGPLRDAVVASFLTNPYFTRRLVAAFVADPSKVSEARAAIYRQPLVVRGTTAAVGVWLPTLLGPPGDVASAKKDAYRAMRAPTLIVWGAADTVTPLSQGRDLQGLIPGSELSVLPGIGHIPQIEDPPEFNARLVKFLTR